MSNQHGMVTPRVQRRRSAALANGGVTGGRNKDKRALYHCNYCQKDISQKIRIKCAVCPDFDLCLECFSVGVEIRPHKSFHAYRVVDNLSFPIYEPTWGADEELLLLEGVDMYGISNWAAIAEHVGTKSSDECKIHYFKVYIDHDDFPRPKATKEMLAYQQQTPADEHGRHAILKSPAQAAKPSRDGAGSITGGLDAAGDTVMAEAEQPPVTPLGSNVQGRSTTAETKGKPKDDSSRHEAAVEKGRLHGKSTRGPPTPKAAGAELDQHATNALALSPHVTRPLDSASPSAIPTVSENAYEITGFHVKRSEFDPEHDQDAELMISDLEFIHGEPEEERKKKLRLLDIYNMRLDERERRRSAILERGLLDVKAAQEYEKTLTPVGRILHGQMRPFERYHTVEEHRALLQGLAIEYHLRTRIEQLKECRRAGIRKLVDAEAFENEKRRKLGDHRNTAVVASSRPGPRSRDDPQGAVSALIAGREHILSSAVQDRASDVALLAWRTKRGVPLDITCLPGVEQLTQLERKLCATTRLTPPQYLAAKEELMQHCQDAGHVTLAEARSMLKMDAIKVSRIYEVLSKQDLIVSSPAPEATA